LSLSSRPEMANLCASESSTTITMFCEAGI
jgi:hypothetical protein